jgi:AraC-like DNA-binding protein
MVECRCTLFSKYYFAVVILLLASAASAQKTLPFATIDKKIDGRLDDWQVLPLDIESSVSIRYRNQNHAAIEWNEEFLFVCFDVKDKLLCANESGDTNPRLYFNDAIEIYLDAKNDSDKRMDKNDYQFLISITGDKVIFKGDKHLIQEGYAVPKEFDNNDILINSATLYHGTINQMNDKDEGYTIEAAIPWSTVGLIPSKGMIIKLDLCVDDIDTFTNVRVIPDTIHPLSMNFVNLSGKTEFGFPGDWTLFRLDGQPSMVQKMRRMISAHFILFFAMLFVIVSMFAFIIIRQYIRIEFYKNFPRKADTDEVLYHTESKINIETDVVRQIKPLHETIEKLRIYIIANIKEDIAIEELSKAANLGVRQLQRLFKSELNITPVQYLNILKLEEAAIMLKDTNQTVSEIAYHFGYNDPSYFGSVFKKYFGMTPVEYRKWER